MNLKLPQTVTAADLAKLAAPDETHAVRVILRRIVNTGPATVRGAKRRYIFHRDATVCAHILDIPESVWMAGAPKGTYIDNLSISHDLQGNRIASKAPLIIQIVPWKGAAQVAAEKSAKAAFSGIMEMKVEPAPLEAFRTLAETMNAPDVILSAIELLASDLPADEKVATLAETTTTVRQQIAEAEAKEIAERHREIVTAHSEASHSASPPSERPAPKSGAERAKALRARRKAEKEAAKLQTA